MPAIAQTCDIRVRCYHENGNGSRRRCVVGVVSAGGGRVAVFIVGGCCRCVVRGAASGDLHMNAFLVAAAAGQITRKRMLGHDVAFDVDVGDGHRPQHEGSHLCSSSRTRVCLAASCLRFWLAAKGS